MTAERTVLRADSTFDSHAVRVLPPHATVVYLDYQSDVTGYMRVAVGSDTGWVAGELLREVARRSLTRTAGCGQHCGFERWAVKTLTDADAGQVSYTATTATIEELRLLPAPAVKPANGRAGTPERATYRVSAKLKGWVKEADGDYHLVLRSSTHPTQTLIAEVPSPNCQNACSSPKLAAFKTVRAKLEQKLGPAPSSYHAISPALSVTIKGVGFFDFIHGQNGVAPNGIELHPVTSITFQ